jgi:hypothetical protein
MKLKQLITDALDGAFLVLARIGPEDRKKMHGFWLLTAWLIFFFYGLFYFIHYWAYPVYDIYLEWWPYRSKNFRSPHSTTFPLATGAMIVAGWVSYRTSKRCSALIDYAQTTWKEWAYFSLWWGGVIFATALAKNKYTCIVLVLAHLAAFYLVARHAKRASSQRS